MDLIVRRRGHAEIILTLSRLSFPHFATRYFAFCVTQPRYRVTQVKISSRGAFPRPWTLITNVAVSSDIRLDRFVTPEAISPRSTRAPLNEKIKSENYHLSINANLDGVLKFRRMNTWNRERSGEICDAWLLLPVTREPVLHDRASLDPVVDDMLYTVPDRL